MRLELKAFQSIKKDELRRDLFTATSNYMATGVPQVISFTAPTGSGKTIIISALMEDVFFGDSMYPDNPNAIFVWLSDAPKLNKQSKDKIEDKSDKIQRSQCIMIEDNSFDQEMLDDGYIYFLNTQKLSKSANLVKHGDSRTYTIWETLANTVKEKANHLYFIIDEAHRGMHDKDAAKATTIMQKFLKGSPKDGLPPMPVVIGMSATMERFNNLVKGTTSSTQYCVVTPDDVRDSGLLKDRIIITYPDKGTDNETAILQAACDDYKDKCRRWDQYCTENHASQVNPILVIQVQNGTTGVVSKTDLVECLTTIETRLNYKFSLGEVVHTFGDTNGSIAINGLDIIYEEPYNIEGTPSIKVVFFKENLSTGWDCPRAETMMSYRPAKDSTYIAQLLGRMIRNPKQHRIQDDEILNDVHLYLPHFDRDTVQTVVDDLQSEEGGEIATDIESESLSEKAFSTLTVSPSHPAKSIPVNRKPTIQRQVSGQTSIFRAQEENTEKPENLHESTCIGPRVPHEESQIGQPNVPGSNPEPNRQPKQDTINRTKSEEKSHISQKTIPEPVIASSENKPESNPEEEQADLFDRNAVIKYINNLGLLSYSVRKTKVYDYLKSLYDMVHLLDQHGISDPGINETDEVTNDIVNMIREYIEMLKETGKYEELANQVKNFELKVQIFDVFNGKPIEDAEYSLFTSTESDIDRQFRHADRKLGDNGICVAYGKKYAVMGDMISYKVDVILFVTDEECMSRLDMYAKNKFHDLDNKYRRIVAIECHDRERDEYNRIVKNGDEVSPLAFRLPETIPFKEEGDEYNDHLYVKDDTGTVRIKLGPWEKASLEEERANNDFVCWIRNPQRSQKYGWALTIPYEINGETKPMFPDFIIVRKDPRLGYVVDILEPHGPQYADGLAKAQGMARYAKNNPMIGRVQIARECKDALGQKRFKRIDLSQNDVNEAVRKALRNDDLNFIFDRYGVIVN